MTILISYDKFTQCNKNLAEHQFANCVFKLCNTSLVKLRIKKKKLQKQLGNEAMREALSCFSFLRIYMTLGPNKLGNVFWGLWHLDMFLPVCWIEEGFNAALPSGWDAHWVFGRFWVLFQILIIFLGQTTSLVCACHCCFCSAWVYSLAFHFNSCPGTSVLGWCLCCRAEVLSSSCLLPALPQGHRVPRAHHRGQKAKCHK